MHTLYATKDNYNSFDEDILETYLNIEDAKYKQVEISEMITQQKLFDNFSEKVFITNSTKMH